MGEWLYCTFAAGSFHTQKLCSRLYSIAIEKNVLSHALGGLKGNIRTPSIAHWKAVVNFLFVIINLFRYLLRLRRYKRKPDGVFRKGRVTLSANFRRKGVAY